MTCKELISRLANWDSGAYNTDSAARLVLLAYHMGREAAAKEVSDKYNALLAAQRDRAKSCRYNHMAAAVLGDARYIYSPDYRQEVTRELADEPTALTEEALQ